ncbi:hypothetical protein [Kribbella soli]|uniref:CBM6 domain-containing protein n=1 Tax=Kribbella soli TaxID=1124743 RepID=A0A4R0H9W9_9ACTN|nr:hypothetical protein [Kribbella soli]TCC07775.1 hypothetical protein E0H45_17635 [Kribbella soli]
MPRDSRPKHHRPRPAAAATALVSALALTIGAVTAQPSTAAATTETLAVDFSQTTGDFRGGASGTLYGLGDDGVPSQPVLNGAHVTNTSQKPPDGAQHPNGDVLDVEKSFFAGAGKDLLVYVPDMYPDWPYNKGKRPGDDNNDGVWDYLPIIRQVAETIATTSAHPKDIVFVPFNEPEGPWYPVGDWANQKDLFLADWSAAYDAIQAVYAEHGLGHAKIGGPGWYAWHQQPSADLLAYGKAHNQLPDLFIWHELGTQNLATFRGNYTQYEALLTSLGLPRIPVNITEFGMLRDMGTPGQLVQWMSMFEDAKVDAETAYWNYSGNLSDNSSRNNGGNGGWWMFKWYGDLAGTKTVKVTPPRLNAVDTLQGMAAVDTVNKKATVLFGGGSQDVNLSLTGLDPRRFGNTVDVTVRADRLNGAEGASLQPPVVLSERVAVSNGQLQLTVPNSDRYSAYQVQITPAIAARQPVSTDLVSSVEAENTTVSNATVYYEDPTREWSFMASNSRDVGSFNQAASSATWSVTAPHSGSYRLSILAGTNGVPGKHALFVDGVFAKMIDYSAGLHWTYRGTTDVPLTLSAGTHTLSVRGSKDGTTRLPGLDIVLDRFDLYDNGAGENAVYPAVDARLAGGAKLAYSQAGTSGYAALSGPGTATVFAATAATGYYDITTHFATTKAHRRLKLTVNGRPVVLPEVDAVGSWAATARVYLPQGINELTVSAPAGDVLLGDVATSRGAAQLAAEADPANVRRVEAESLTLAGTAAVESLPAATGSNGSADVAGVVHDVIDVGKGSGNTITMARPQGFGAGQYQLVFSAANADKSDPINYNPQVISRFLDVSEAGGSTVRGAFRHNYSWNSFWDKTIPLTLVTGTGALTIGNPTGPAPHLDTVTLAKFAAGRATISAVR